LNNFYRSPFSKWPPQYCKNSTLSDIINIWYMGYDYILTIMKSLKPATDNPLKNKLRATFEIEQCWIFAVLWRLFWKWRPVEIFRCQESIRDIIWTISIGRHFQNGRHNTAKIQHCPISSTFDIWVDNDVPNWFPTFKNFYRSTFSKWPPQ
jgi:hypothetical protein